MENRIDKILIYKRFYPKMQERGILNLLKDLKLGEIIELILETYDKIFVNLATRNKIRQHKKEYIKILQVIYII